MRLHNLAVHFFGLLRRSAKRRNGIDEFKPFPITQREKDCLQWTGVGRSDWDISALLGISEATVRLHLQRAMHKLGVPTRTQAVVQAILSGQIVL
ncbi:MAG: helix-turn-helix transcriptional regulator [Alphaproteobacteria bacterium]